MNREKLREFEEADERIFLLRGLIEVRISKEEYEDLSEKYSKDQIISL